VQFFAISVYTNPLENLVKNQVLVMLVRVLLPVLVLLPVVVRVMAFFPDEIYPESHYTYV